MNDQPQAAPVNGQQGPHDGGGSAPGHARRIIARPARRLVDRYEVLEDFGRLRKGDVLHRATVDHGQYAAHASKHWREPCLAFNSCPDLPYAEIVAPARIVRLANLRHEDTEHVGRTLFQAARDAVGDGSPAAWDWFKAWFKGELDGHADACGFEPGDHAGNTGGVGDAEHHRKPT